jgi:hypothetical protein
MAKGKVVDITAWDMSTKEARERQVKRDFALAYNKNAKHQKFMVELDDYYNNKHYTKDQILALAAEKGWDFAPPILPDPYIQVESLIDPRRPDFTFKGRDNDTDSEKAKERQDAVEYVLYNNRVDDMMTQQERRLNKFGNNFWKVAFDDSIQGTGYIGEITIGDPDIANCFPLNPEFNDIDDQEMFFYVYPMHRRAARRKYGKIIDDISGTSVQYETEVYNTTYDYVKNNFVTGDTLQVVEAWYRNDDGDMACSIQINFVEVKHIKKYWLNTAASGNRMYPFVKSCKIPVDKSFWDKGELEAIKDLVDAGDREFLQAIMKDMFEADDYIVCEENALKAGTTINKAPGAIIWTKDGKSSGIRRLGGVTNNINALNMITFIHEKIQETNGNFDPNQGKAPPPNVKTLGGMQLLNDQGNARKEIKKADRNGGFRRLYELIDWSVLEFYNQDRIMLLRGNQEYNKKNQDAIMAGKMQPKPTTMTFNSDNYRLFDQRKYLALLQKKNAGGENIEPGVNDQEIAQASSYYPRLDTEIIISNPIQQNKATMVQATEQISAQLDKLNPAKAELLKSEVEIMGLPNEREIKDAIDMEVKIQQQIQQAQQQVPQQKVSETMAFKDLPPEGKIQMAAHAGIQLSQQSVIQQPQEGQQVHPVDQVLQALSPEQQEDLLSLPQDQQVAMIQKLMGG